jgi:hypothetical protein
MAWGESRSSAEDKRFRRIVLAQDHTCRCQGCKHHPGPCGQPATQADHIRNRQAGGTNDPHTNGQGLCHPCHTTKTTAEALAARHATPRQRPTEAHPGWLNPTSTA